MHRIAIGIPVYAEPERLQATLASLRVHTPSAYAPLLLPDGPDGPTQAVLATLRDIPQSATTAPCGAAACFNRLVSAGAADVFILLESGAIVGPGWLDHLLAALDADPRHGLAGPSTNHVWNEQGVFPRSGGTSAEVIRTAAKAVQRFNRTWRTLEPLYSLADFCYAVRREVVEAIGGADEGYGLGPCWEMDYNIRAARAGWQGVWACAAYVYRSPVTVRRRRDEALYFEVSKRRYQDKFCGARLRGEKKDYRSHCRGDACPSDPAISPRADDEPGSPSLRPAWHPWR
jgi:GT2 family glycosyltransferase